MTSKELKIKSIEYRRKILQYIVKAKAGHTGGSLSCVDVLNVLYNEVMHVSPENFTSPDRDRYIQSKGHCVEALFVVLADKGFFPEEDLNTLCRYQSHYIGHPTRKVNGVEQNTGALGHGLPIASGMAIAAKLDHKAYKVYTLLGDGEMPEGSNWEAALSAAQYELDNLCAIVDKNGLQITAATKDVCSTDPLDKKWEAFGWAVREVDGNDVDALKEALLAAPFEKGKPSVIIAHTTKGKGVSFMENQLKWHHKVPTLEEFDKANQELENAAALLL
ncbi:transketolase [Arachidicoccus terrestris]|uniref:transketolase n=1 Tax=Arachidicoccus terrestris TaxID=2875539 RepID=UPI001CC5D542|nr:transketolase [Arachidicoccus terrestris]UAY54008.1 transketolase [Arachidicoccus terrestris]